MRGKSGRIVRVRVIRTKYFIIRPVCISVYAEFFEKIIKAEFSWL